MATLAHEVTDVDTPLQEGETLSLQELCIADRNKNYSDDEISGEEVFAALPVMQAKGDVLYRAGDTMWVTWPLPHKGIEFHSCNAENGAGLTRNILAFFDLLKSKGYTYALTYYDFPQITHLFSKSSLDVTIEKIDGGKHRTYQAKVRL